MLLPPAPTPLLLRSPLLLGASTAASALGYTLQSTSTAAATSALVLQHRRPRPPPRPQRLQQLIQRRGFLQEAGGDWEETWRRQTTPWDTGAPAPPLLYLLRRTDGSAPLPREPGKSRALVGGCGSGYDCWTLAQFGWRVTGLDLSPTAIERAKGLWEKEGGEGGVDFVCGDFFALPEEEGHQYDLIFDYTFLCALPPALRRRWVGKTKRLLTPGHGQLVALLFPVQRLDKPTAALNTQEGPPFEVSGPLYTELLEGPSDGEEGDDKLVLERLELSGPCPESIKPRRGREWLGRWRRPG